jgi:tRNA pseudouridine55 synthase
MFSAKKFGGEPLYKLARRGEVVERQPNSITISEFTINNFRGSMADFFVRCSKGTYVRTLIHDFGCSIDCGAHLLALRRTKIGEFSLRNANAFGKICATSRDEIRNFLITSYLAKKQFR